MSLRAVVLAISSLEALLWIVVLIAALASSSDPATRGLDTAFVIIATAIFVLFTVPAFGLALYGRWIGVAFALVMVLPVALIIAALLFVNAIEF